MRAGTAQEVQPEWLRYPDAERYSGLGRSTLWKLVICGDVHTQALKNSPLQIAYAPRTDATPQAGLAALAAVYRFLLFESSASKERACQLAKTVDTDDTLAHEGEVTHEPLTQ
jgi:hypothetical protein